LKGKTIKDTKLKFYKIMATAALLHGCQNGVTKQRYLQDAG